MSDVKRYALNGGSLIEHSDGRWVHAAHYDALCAAAAKVTCWRCGGSEVIRHLVCDGTEYGHEEQNPCPDCADLGALLEVKP